MRITPQSVTVHSVKPFIDSTTPFIGFYLVSYSVELGDLVGTLQAETHVYGVDELDAYLRAKAALAKAYL